MTKARIEESLELPDKWPFQAIWNCSAQRMIERVAELQREGQVPQASLVIADPPWEYENMSAKMHGAAKAHYDGEGVITIAHTLNNAFLLCSLDAYLQLWCTFPKLEEWLITGLQEMRNAFPHRAPNEQRGWRYTTGGAWGKTNGMGPGFHFRGDAEVMLLYTKGAPQARTEASNLWLAPRVGHSQKPQLALRRQIDMATSPGDLVIDLYAGEGGTAARACRALGRGYIGAELSAERYKKAQDAFAQVDLFEEAYPLERKKEQELRLYLPTDNQGGAGWTEPIVGAKRKRLLKEGHT